MIGTKLIATTVAGAAFGAGTLALTPSMAAGDSSGASARSARSEAKGLAIRQAKNVIHGSWVTHNSVRHEAIRGVVRTVNSSFITVRAEDGFTQTYKVTKDTKVRVLRDGDKGLVKIGDVKVGYRAVVVGVGNDISTRIVAAEPKASSSSS